MSFELDAAKEYNLRVQGKLWQHGELASPLNDERLAPGSDAFSFAVASFQAAVGLVVDGRLGPATLAALRAFKPYDVAGQGCSQDGVAGDIEEQPRGEARDPKPARTSVSNRLVIDGVEVPLSAALLAAGVTCSNWRDDGEAHFAARRRSEPLHHFVLHESVTTSVAATIRVLNAKRRRRGWDYGIHFNVGPDGHITQHNDPVLDRLVHANHLNDTSAGVEITNPYNPKFGGAPWINVIPGPWWCWRPKGASRVYTLPTNAQMRVLAPLCQILSIHCVDLPLSFPTRNLNRRKKRIQGWSDGALPPPGFVAHRDFAAHSDGRYLLEHVINLLDGGPPPAS
ncbi:MAG: N-acetylmuramoyl-L-alanine amidase [Nannocystaceae bacterium]|nr:N-acetylmuramoyl-L-alanine amidase [Nannocystaceae bacterium]